MEKINSNKTAGYHSFEIKNVLELILISFLSFSLFILPLKLGAPYIDEIGFFIPTLAELFFGSWPALGLCYISLFIMILLFINSLALKKISLTISFTDILFLLFFSVSLFSIIHSVNPHSSILNNYILLSSGAGYLIAKKTFSLYDRNAVFLIAAISILVAASFVSVNGIHQYFYGLREMRELIGIDQIKNTAMLYKESDPQNYSLYLRLMSNRIFSTFVYPNSLSGYLCMIFPFLLELGRLNKKDFVRIYSVTAIISALVLSIWFYLQSQTFFIPVSSIGALFFPVSICLAFFFTGSKGGLITLAILVFVYILIFLFKKIKKSGCISLSFALLILLPIILFSIPSHKIKSFYARLDYWKSSVMMIKDSPVYGFGLGSFGNVYPKYRLETAEETQFAHNNYLQLACETGVAGASIYFILLLYSLIKFLKSHCHEYPGYLQSCAGFALLCFFIHGFVDFDLFIPALGYYAFFMIGITQTGLCKKYIFELNIRISKLILIAGLFMLIYFYNTITDYFKAQYLLNHAKFMYYQKNEYEKPLDLLNLAITLDKKNGKLYFLKGNIYFNNKNFEKAVENYELAVYYERHRSSYRYQLAQALIMSGNPQNRKRADTELKKARSLNPYKKQL